MRWHQGGHIVDQVSTERVGRKVLHAIGVITLLIALLVAAAMMVHG